MNRPLIAYLPPVNQAQAQARVKATQPAQPNASGAHKYVGEVAKGYDAKRENTPKHIAEQKVVEGFLSDLPAGTWVLDAPCGTGRFFQFYAHKGFIVRGLDASADMIKLAAAKISTPNAMIGDHAQWMFAQGDVRDTKLPDRCVDVVVLARISRWLSPEDNQTMFREMQRVSRSRIILTARVSDHPHARPLELYLEALAGGWRLDRNEQGHEPPYRILMFKRDE